MMVLKVLRAFLTKVWFLVLLWGPCDLRKATWKGRGLFWFPVHGFSPQDRRAGGQSRPPDRKQRKGGSVRTGWASAQECIPGDPLPPTGGSLTFHLLPAAPADCILQWLSDPLSPTRGVCPSSPRQPEASHVYSVVLFIFGHSFPFLSFKMSFDVKCSYFMC